MQTPKLLNICTLTAAITLPSFFIADYYLKDCTKTIMDANPQLSRLETIEYEIRKLTTDKTTTQTLETYVTDKEFATQYNNLRDEYKKIKETPEIKIAQQQIQNNYANPAFKTLLLATLASLLPLAVAFATKRERLVREGNNEKQPLAAEAVTPSDADY